MKSCCVSEPQHQLWPISVHYAQNILFAHQSKYINFSQLLFQTKVYSCANIYSMVDNKIENFKQKLCIQWH